MNRTYIAVFTAPSEEDQTVQIITEEVETHSPFEVVRIIKGKFPVCAISYIKLKQ